MATAVLECAEAPRTLPRAHAVNPRTIEILRELSVEADQLRDIAAPHELTSDVRFVTTRTGVCFGTGGPAQAHGISVEEARRRQAASIAAGRLGEPAEIGAACVFLCSAHAGYISGVNLRLDGGSYPGLL